MPATVTILGSNSAVSVHNRFPSGQYLQVDQDIILIDCGEGTQFRMSEYHLKKSKINTILITHLHGDHVFGLPGLLTSYQLAGRKEKLTIFGPEPLQQFLEINLGGTGHFIDYPLEIIEIDFEDIQEKGILRIADLKNCYIEAFELVHRIPCMGFRVHEKKRKNKIKKSFIQEHNPSIRDIKQIKKGGDYETKSGVIIPNNECTEESPEPRSYAYCSDTLYHPPLKDLLKGTTTIYHESTYLENLVDKAVSRYHSTATQAADIAKGASAQKLVLGHFSSRYENLTPFIEEASEIFPNVVLAKEGKVIEI